MSTNSRKTWADFWEAGGAGPESGCLPKALSLIDAAQRKLWGEAVRSLPRRARVLDLATGDGAVLGKIRDARPDLVLVGVDSSPKLPPSPKGIALHAGVAIEDLPFADDSFDLVTSQFGFEYGETQRAAVEVARVAKPGASFAFIIHHADGPIVAHNRARRGAIHWAVAESGALGRARALVGARAGLPIPTPASFHRAVAEAGARFPEQPVAAEFMTAVLQTLELGRNYPPVQSLDALQTLESRGRNEIGRIDALLAAACGSEKIEILAQQLRDAGLEPRPEQLVHEKQGKRPFAWHLSGHKA